MDGRILYYNPHTGHGKLILKSQDKLEFYADLWIDFDDIPSAGKLVSCVVENGVLISVQSASSKNALDELDLNRSIEDSDVDLDVDQADQARSYEGEYKCTFSIDETIQNYFKPIAILIGKPPSMVHTIAQLDYFLVKRFLMTAYNDLKSLDRSLHNNAKIKKLLEEISQLQKAYHTIEARLDTPKLAFEMIFLRSQPEYLRFIRHKEHCLSHISMLSKIEESLFPDMQAREEELKLIPKTEATQRAVLEKELKSMRRNYVDTIHENAELFEELSTMEDLKVVYTQKYSEEFLTKFLKVGAKHLETLKSILNYRAYDLDKLIWAHAEESKVIREFLSSASIEGEYSTLTFLRYYLKTLNPDKLNVEQKELFKLEEYLECQDIYKKTNVPSE